MLEAAELGKQLPAFILFGISSSISMSPPLRLTRVQTTAKLCCEWNLIEGFSSRQIAPIIPRPSFNSSLLNTPTTTSTSHSSTTRSFSTTPQPFKKGAPKAKNLLPNSSSTAHIPDNKAQANRDREIDPYDFSDLEAKITQQLDWLKDSLQKLRSGGRLSPETIEGFHVEIKHGLGGEGGQGKKVEKVRLGDLAQVVRSGGRMIRVLVGEETVRWPTHFLTFPLLPYSGLHWAEADVNTLIQHLKSITTAIQSSPYSLTPQPADPHNPLQLSIPIPPPTAESRQRALADAKKEYEKAGMGVRDARGQWQKWYRKAEKEKLVIRDELEKAHKRMEVVVEKGHKGLKEVYEQAVKAMER